MEDGAAQRNVASTTHSLIHQRKGIIMNKFNALILAAVTVVASTSALAGGSAGSASETYYWEDHAQLSTLTRTEVGTEFQRAKAAGEVQFHNVSLAGFPKNVASSTLTRAEVVAEYQRAKNAGEIEFHSASLSTTGKGTVSTRGADDMASVDGGLDGAQVQRATR
jgi:hypothetical protein